MKRIDAIIKTSRLDDIVNRLWLVGITGMTFAEVHGMSPSTATTTVSHGRRFTAPMAPRYQLTIVVDDSDAPHVVNAIVHSAQTGMPGDGLITVSDVLGVMRIRTGETDAAAI